MTIERDGDLIRLAGACGVEDVEALLEHLLAGPSRIELSGCEHLHAALFQLLLASGARIEGEIPPFLRRWNLFAPGPADERR
jgi:hypothetical protein